MNSKTVDQLEKLLEVSPNTPVFLEVEREGIITHPLVYVQNVTYLEIMVAQIAKEEKSSILSDLTFSKEEVKENISVPKIYKPFPLNSKKIRSQLIYQKNPDCKFLGKIPVKLTTKDKRSKGAIHPVGYFEGITEGEIGGNPVEYLALGSIKGDEISIKKTVHK